MPASLQQSARHIAEIAFSLFLIAVASLFLLDLRGLRMSAFDFLSGAAVPRALCWSLIALSAFSIGRSVYNMLDAGRPVPAGAAADEVSAAGARTGLQLAAVIAISAGYVLSIVHAIVPYSVSTAILLSSTMAILAPSARRNIILIVVLACLIGGLCEYLFTSVLPLPLPRF